MQFPIAASPHWLLRQYWAIVIAASVFLSGLLALIGEYPLLSSFLAFLLLGMFIFPIAKYQLEGSREFPTIAIVSVAHAIQYALPVFFGYRVVETFPQWTEIDQNALVSALCLTIVGAVVFLVVCYNNIFARVIRQIPALDLRLNRKRAVVFCAVFWVLSQSVSPSADAVQYNALIQVIRNQVYVVIGILSWLAFTSQGIWIRVALYMTVAASVAIGMSSGAVALLVSPIVVWLAAQWFYTRRINKLVVVFLALSVIFFSPAKFEFRQRVWLGNDANTTHIERMAIWLESAASYWGDVLAGNVSSQAPIKQLARRASLIDSLAHVYASTPESTPFLHGTTYSLFAYTAIPRFIWPDKPKATANSLLAEKYWLTTPEGLETSSFGVGLIAESYANFGWLGVPVIMFVLASVLLIMQQLFGTARSLPGGAALLIGVAVTFMSQIESSAEIMLGNVLQSIFLSFVLLYWVTEKSPRYALP